MDNAFERARAAYGTGAYDDATLEFLFPQLKESEDERIREWLIDYFTRIGKSWIHREFTCKQIIAYLEKQKECVADNSKTSASEDERIRTYFIWIVKNVLDNIQGLKLSKEQTRELIDNYDGIKVSDMLAWLEKQKDASKAIEAVDRIDKFIDEHLANAHDMKDSDPDKKYYRGWDDALGKMAGILQDVYSGSEQKEQKPAEWSEEDELMRTTVIQTLERFGGCGTTGMQIDWLKSLRPRPKQEWSKDDERMIRCITNRIESDIQFGNELTKALGNQEISWLKSLRPSWKPSGEHMEALHIASYGADPTPESILALAGLYEQLKQL